MPLTIKIDFSFLSGLNETDNIKKYVSKNPLIKYSVDTFIATFIDLVEICDKGNMKRVLDAGIGEGALDHILSEKFKNLEIIGLDISLENLNMAKQITIASLIRGDINNFPFKQNSMDLVVSLEVLEHMAEPESAMLEIKRVSREFAIFSVPNDRIFRLGNILRGKNLADFGNGPGHVQHFSKNTFIELIQKHFKIIAITKPANLWIMCLVTKN